MSGHSHWASIRHKKGAADKKKGKIFSKIARLIMVAAREAGGDPDANLKLQYAIEEARAANMPRDNVTRAIKKGTGELQGEQLEAFLYEGFGPGGVAILVEGLSDNRNRTGNELRGIFDKSGGNMGSSNSVAWMFERKGLFTLPGEAAEEDKLLEDALEAGAENVELSGEFWEITCAPNDFAKVRAGLAAKYTLQSAELSMIPKNYVAVDETSGRKILALMEALDNHDDVNHVYANFDLPENLA